MRQKDIKAALAAVRFYQRTRGVEEEIVRHSPLHYHIADLVTGLMELSKREGLNFRRILKDAGE